MCGVPLAIILQAGRKRRRLLAEELGHLRVHRRERCFGQRAGERSLSCLQRVQLVFDAVGGDTIRLATDGGRAATT